MRNAVKDQGLLMAEQDLMGARHHIQMGLAHWNQTLKRLLLVHLSAMQTAINLPV